MRLDRLPALPETLDCPALRLELGVRRRTVAGSSRPQTAPLPVLSFGPLLRRLLPSPLLRLPAASAAVPRLKRSREGLTVQRSILTCLFIARCRNNAEMFRRLSYLLRGYWPTMQIEKTSHIRQLWIQQETDCKTHWTQLKREWQIRNDLCGSIYGIFQPADGLTGATYASHSTDVCLRVGSNSSSGRLVTR